MFEIVHGSVKKSEVDGKFFFSMKSLPPNTFHELKDFVNDCLPENIQLESIDKGMESISLEERAEMKMQTAN
jgi:hypothetical protein